jgi:hypothetical protein
MGMKRLSWLILFGCLSPALVWTQNPRPLVNQDVIDLLASGLSDAGLIEKIREAGDTSFDTSLDGLKMLIAAKVPEGVIKVMINPRGNAATHPSGFPIPAQIPGVSMSDMFAYKRPDGSFLPLASSGMPNYKVTGEIKRIFDVDPILPRAYDKRSAIYEGSESNVHIAERRPVFYMHDYAAMIDLKNVFIVRLTKKKDHRELPLSENAYCYLAGSGCIYPERSSLKRIEVVTTRVAEGVVSVVPKEDLADGEYAITNDKDASGIWDFSIAVPAGKRQK